MDWEIRLVYRCQLQSRLVTMTYTCGVCDIIGRGGVELEKLHRM